MPCEPWFVVADIPAEEKGRNDAPHALGFAAMITARP